MTINKNMRFTCGRFNPVTKGHQRIFSSLNDGRVYVTRSHDAVRNPLNIDQKIKFIREIFDGEVYSIANPYSCIDGLVREHIQKATMVIGADRDYSRLVEYALTKNLHLTLEILDRTEEDESATKARSAVKLNDFESFRLITPVVNLNYSMRLFNAVKAGLEENGK